ncbi:hypothetical protein CR513_48207, partial [Mucuna pruriens]
MELKNDLAIVGKVCLCSLHYTKCRAPYHLCVPVAVGRKWHTLKVHRVHSKAQGKKPMDINDHFKEFIQHSKDKMMRSVSNIDWAQSNPATAAPNHEAHDSSNKSAKVAICWPARSKLNLLVSRFEGTT